MEKPLTGRQVFFALAAFFGVVLFANGLMMWQAARTYDGLASDDAWREGRDHDAALAAARAQAALGWQAEIVEMSTTGATLGFADAAGRPLDGLEIAGSFVSPVDAAEDRPIRAEPLGAGRYRLPAALPRPGNWRLEIIARDDAGAEHRIEKGLFVRR